MLCHPKRSSCSLRPCKLVCTPPVSKSELLLVLLLRRRELHRRTHFQQARPCTNLARTWRQYDQLADMPGCLLVLHLCSLPS